MKGKYANAAERRRYIEGLEQRTAAAEREQARAAAELAALQARHERMTNDLRASLSAAREQRDQNAAPQLTAAEERISALMAESALAAEVYKALETKYRRLSDAVIAWVQKDTGCTGVEALEIFLGIVNPGKGGTIVDGDAGADRSMMGTPMERIWTLQRTRGKRSGTAVQQRLEERFAQARDNAEVADE